MKSIVRSLLAVWVAALWVGALAFAASADDGAEDGAAIRAVIARQLEAFARDDWAEAFGYASPGIQSMFRTPERFGGMVREGYPMVWRPARVEPGPLERGPGGVVQIMYFEDAAGVLHVAAYEMVAIDGAWRIAGVRVRRAPDLSA